VSTSHLVTDFNFSSLRHIDLYLFKYSCWEVVSIFTTKDMNSDNFPSRT
jgi:hypothetical protein